MRIFYSCDSVQWDEMLSTDSEDSLRWRWLFVLGPNWIRMENGDDVHGLRIAHVAGHGTVPAVVQESWI